MLLLLLVLLKAVIDGTVLVVEDVLAVIIGVDVVVVASVT